MLSKLPFFILLILISSCNTNTSTPSKVSQEDSTGSNTSPKVLTVDAFVPKDYAILTQKKTDFNMDGFEDVVLILKSINEQETSDYANDKPTLRPLLFLAGDKIGSLNLVARNDKAVYCFDCGGQMGDPFNALVVDKQFVSIEHYGGSQDRWTRNITFKYDTEAKAWLLYKDEQEGFQASNPLEEQKSDNKQTHLPLESFDIYSL